MGIAVMEELIVTVKAILKTVECPICLELLRTPVSAGCGHFFCKECAAGILQSTYCAPCPLCKRSFTRRSIQEAHQRQAVISAARSLAQTCGCLTGVNLIASENSNKKGRKSVDALPEVAPKKFKVTPKRSQDGSYKKRKSCESEGYTSADQDDLNMNETGVNNCNTVSTEESSSKRRLYQKSDDEDNLPSLKELLTGSDTRTSSATLMQNKECIEKPLSVFPLGRISNIKTYSRTGLKGHKIIEEKNSPLSHVSHSSNKKAIKISNFNTDDSDNNSASLDKNKSNAEIERGTFPNEIVNCHVKLDRINALKNKTNEVKVDHHVLKDDGFLLKPKCTISLKPRKLMRDKQEYGSKENELVEDPSTCLTSSSSSKSNRMISKKFKKLMRSQSQNEKNSISMDKNSENDNAMKFKDSTKKSEENTKECFILNEPSIPNIQNENKQISEKPIDDPFKAMELTDTAVSVDSVTSPLSAKAVSLNKSPGWSRVKKVKKDFKVKNFSLLHIEKNSPSTFHKHSAVGGDCTTDQDVYVGKINDFGTVLKENDEKKINSNDQSNNLQDINALSPKNVKGTAKIIEENSNVINLEVAENVSVNMNKESCGMCQVIIHEQGANTIHALNSVHVDISNSAVPQEELGEMLCISAKNNDFSNINENESCKVNENPEKNLELFQDVGEITHNPTSLCELNKQDDFDQKVIGNVFEKPTRIVYDNCFDQNMDTTNSLDTTNQGMLITVPTDGSECENIPLQPTLNDDNNPQFVEHSQQTTQKSFNFANQNLLYNNFALVNPQQPQFSSNLNTEKTKVVKRTCFTLEEIQDSFIKSNQSKSAELLYCAPFLSGQFKLHIGISEETLNISVLRVIDLDSENTSAVNAYSLLSEKHIQTPNSVLQFHLPSMLPSSNPESESSQQDLNSVTDPFPYLKPSCNIAITKDNTPVVTAVLNSPKSLIESDLEKSEVLNDQKEDGSCARNLEVTDLNASEIIHFPSKYAYKGNEKFETNVEYENLIETQAVPVEDEISTENHKHDSNKFDGCDMSNKDELKSPQGYDTHNDLSPSKLCKNSSAKFEDSDSGSLNSDSEAPLKKLQQCANEVQSVAKLKKRGRLSLKTRKSKLRRTQKIESSDESDLETSVSKNVSVNEANTTTPKYQESPKQVSSQKSGIKEPVIEIKSKDVLNFSSIGDAEMPSTLNSVLSEDAPEANASEIILEIEDLADKIKSLEEKLKQCGHSNSSSESVVQKDTIVKESCNSDFHVGGSDSEDSTDLFPQSVPPTPPQPCTTETDLSYKSSFYKLA